MKNNFKFKIWFISFFVACLALLIFSPTKINNTVYATNEKTFSYIISNSTSNKIRLVGKNIDDSEYLISEDLDNFESVFDMISSDLNESGKTIYDTSINIYFSNFSLFNNLTISLNGGLFVFSGSISNPQNNSTFEIASQSNNKYIFDNLIISTINNKIIQINESTIANNIILKNSSFESTALNSYALYFQDTPTNLTLSHENNHTSSYLFNYQPNLNILFDNFEYCQLKATLPSNIVNKTILQNIDTIITQSLKFYPENCTYSIETTTFWYSKEQVFSSLINLNTNINGGNSTEPIKDNFKYNTYYSLPTSITRSPYHFGGWFGVCIIDETTYYFDNQMLQIVADANFEKEAIKNTFVANLNNTSFDYSFTKFFDNSDSQNLIDSENFKALYENISQIPSIIAKWEYKITINNLEGDIEYIYTSIDSTANIDIPTKEGYNFEGWFEDENLTVECNVNDINKDITIFPKWSIGEFELKFYANKNDEIFETQKSQFAQNINYPKFTKTGYYIVGWKTFDDNDFSSATMPGQNLKLYAIWERLTFTTYFENDGNEIYIPINTKYLDSIPQPANPTKLGYTFDKWIDKDTNLDFDFSTTTSTKTAVATWIANKYTATYKFVNKEPELIEFGSEIIYLPVNVGYKFLGWYDENDQMVETMPASDITLYPKWQAKNIISLNLDKQSQQINSSNLGYKIDSTLNNFVVEYYYNNNWNTQTPTSQGIYDVRISRNEDNNYASYNQIIPNGYQILPNYFDLDIVISIALLGLFLEIVAIIFIKYITKQKKNGPLRMSSIILPFAMFDKTKFIIAIISILLFIIGFIWMVRELIILNKTNPEPISENKYDNREIILKKEDSSNDLEIERKVENILIKNNLIEPKNTNLNKIKINNDENDDFEYLNLFDDDK